MGDDLAALGGFALIAGLFVAYLFGRAKSRATKNPAAPPALVLTPATPAGPTLESPPQPQGRSPNWGAPILFCLLLLGAATHRHSVWGYLWQTIFFAFVTVALYSVFSAKDFAIEQRRDPDFTRTWHVLMIGVPYVLFPVFGWVVTIPMGITAGFLIPAVAWAPLILIAVVLAAKEKAKELGGVSKG